MYCAGPEKADRMRRERILSRTHLLTLNNKGKQLLQMYYCSGTGMICVEEKKGSSEANYPILISSKSKFFYSQIYIMLNTISVCEISDLKLYCIFFII
jgi:hypothetical protein